MKNMKNKENNFFSKAKKIAFSPVKNEGRALNIIFVLCLICIAALSLFLYRHFTSFYKKMDDTMQNNISFNIETMQNEQADYILDLLNNKLA